MPYCLASGAAFGAMAIFAKLAYGEGATVGTLLAGRFILAAAAFWVIVAASGAWRHVRALPRRDVLLALALGAGGYALQAGCYFSALTRIDASLLALLLYTFPVMVAAGAVAIGRERLDGRKVVALACALAGLTLIVAAAGTGAVDPRGAALGLGAALTYACYILVSDGIANRVPAIVLAAIVCTGAAISLTAGSALLGNLHFEDVSAAGYGWLVAIAAVSTVAAIAFFFAGLRRVGPTSASILATVEPLTTVILAGLVFGERLGPPQILGGLLVLSAVPLLQARAAAKGRPEAAPSAA